MKKFYAALLSLMMALSLTACGSSSETVTDLPEETVNEEVETSEEEETEASDDEKEETKEEKETEAEAEGEEEETDTGIHGVVDGSTYTNKYFGIKYQALPTYTFLDDATIERMGNMTVDMFDNDTLTEALESGQTVMDCVVTDITMSNSVTITLGSIDSRASEYAMEDILDAALPSLKQMYESMGFEDLVCERSTTTFLGEETPCLNITFTYSNQGTTIDMSMVEVILIRDGYTATITVQADSDEKMTTLLSCFVPAE